MTFTGLTIALGVRQGKSKEQILSEVQDGLNPTSSRFLLFRIGGQLLGPGSKFVSDIRLMSKVMSRPETFLNFEEFNDNPGVKWVRSQSSAVPSTSWDLLTGRTYLGEPITRDFVGDPVKSVLSIGKRLGENAIPIWVQSMLFEGGTPEGRLSRGVGEFGGLRAFPQGAIDLLQKDSFRIFERSYDQLNEPFERTLVRFGSADTDELLKLQQKSAQRGQAFSQYFAALDDIEVNRIRRLENELVNLGNRPFQVASINNEAKGRRVQARVDREFEENDVNDPDPNRRALAQYYAAIDAARNDAGNFPEGSVDRELAKVAPKWTLEQQGFVLRNTNMRPIPVRNGQISNVGRAQLRAYDQSQRAREAYLQAIGKPELIPLLRQYITAMPVEQSPQ